MYQKNTLGIRLSDVLIFHSHPVIAHNLGGGLLYKSYITSDDGEKKKKKFQTMINTGFHTHIHIFVPHSNGKFFHGANQ